MGHANVENISIFFLRRLYAKGSLSIDRCLDYLEEAGEQLHASEGAYSDRDMLGLGLTHVIDYLTKENPKAHGYSGPREGGPWIVPHLIVLDTLPPNLPDVRKMTKACAAAPTDYTARLALVDALEEAGLTEVALSAARCALSVLAYNQWCDKEDEDWEYGLADGSGMGDVFDAIPWLFAPGWRKRYREIPILSNITN